MISHKHKLIFVHIPKCAGSSIEKMIFPDKVFNWRKPDYETLHGWCPERKLFMQHATLSQMLEFELVSRVDFENYKKVSVVRNPYSRAFSGYYWLMNQTQIKDSFLNYILKKGKFEAVLNNNESSSYRGDHLISQKDFLYVNGNCEVDKLYHFESISEVFKDLKTEYNVENRSLHEMKGMKAYSHYSFLFDKKVKDVFDELYSDDLKLFNYAFERSSKASIKDVLKQIRYKIKYR